MTDPQTPGSCLVCGQMNHMTAEHTQPPHSHDGELMEILERANVPRWNKDGSGCREPLLAAIKELVGREVVGVSPEASLAMRVARAHLERGENPPINTTAVLVSELERLADQRRRLEGL